MVNKSNDKNRHENEALRIHQIIEDVWVSSIKQDYLNNKLLLEGTLQSAFYYHLRGRIENSYFSNNIRVFTEFWDKNLLGNNYRADIAVVELVDNVDDELYLRNNVKRVLAIIELKYNNTKDDSRYLGDVEKVKNYRVDENCKFYLGFINEYIESSETWRPKYTRLGKNQRERIKFLLAHYDKPKCENEEYQMQFYVDELV